MADWVLPGPRCHVLAQSSVISTDQVPTPLLFSPRYFTFIYNNCHSKQNPWAGQKCKCIRNNHIKFTRMGWRGTRLSKWCPWQFSCRVQRYVDGKGASAVLRDSSCASGSVLEGVWEANIKLTSDCLETTVEPQRYLEQERNRYHATNKNQCCLGNQGYACAKVKKYYLFFVFPVFLPCQASLFVFVQQTCKRWEFFMETARSFSTQ